MYQVTLASEDGKAEATRSLQVRPRAFTGRTALRLPMRRPVNNYDGHYLLAHHRRFDYRFAQIAQMASRATSCATAYDFVTVDAKGEMHRGRWKSQRRLSGFGSELLAVGDGVVAAVVNDRPNDRSSTNDSSPADPIGAFSAITW